ncbi:MAG: DUF11 domain-containing protein [Bacteroidetes bacterium]|nr:DUF11 domain-containing protein [Bacteroidota bacterium]
MRIQCFTFLFCLFAVLEAQGQYVTIPDSNFRKYLFAHFPNAMLANTMDTTHPSIVTASSVTCDSLFISDLSGIQYFDNLMYLNCKNNMLHSLPVLPANLLYLHCSVNFLDSLPTPLPGNIQTILCDNNHLTFLPNLPISITIFDCSYNGIDTLWAIPPNAQRFNCSHNSIDSLPALPSTLLHLNYSNNNIGNNQTLPLGLEDLDCSNNPLYGLPSLNPSLKSLHCSFNFLSSLPNLPSNLQSLWCNNNQLPNLPALPNSLQYLGCHFNVLTILPVLSSSLLVLHCGNNLLPVLPFIPNGLLHLYCNNNSIPSLPLLPTSLLTLDYSSNPISTLPNLPVNLETLFWNSNPTNILPTLPSSLKSLYASQNNLDSLPTLPNGLTLLICYSDSLTFLPSLPATLLELEFGANQLATMPMLPPNLITLFFKNNLIAVFNTMPQSVRRLNCSDNTALGCLPKIPSIMESVRIDNTTIGCLPNYFFIADTFATSPAIFTLPICTPAGPCLCAWNIAGNAHQLNNLNCALDSVTPGARLKNLTAKLYKNNVLIDQMMVAVNGEYSFDTGNDDTLDVVIDTFDTPLKVTCPLSIAHHVIVSPTDSMKGNVSFGMECSDIDAGVQKILGRFRPTAVSHLNINAGDLAQRFNAICTGNNPGTVTTILQGPISYLSPSANALTPSFINGNMLQYNVPNLSAVDFQTAFDIEVLTDLSATIGDLVCVRTTVSNVANDIQAANDELEVCFPVVSSYDPNAKFVFPETESKPGDELRYLIQFQNTGNDTAYQVVIRDTLSEHLDWGSFVFGSASHAVQVTQNGRYLAFYFHKINLLDSTSNEPESHGWLQYTIHLKADASFGTKTDNRASIYFDTNPPIVTNTATNFIGQDTTFEGGANPFKVANAVMMNSEFENGTWKLLNPEYIARKQIKVHAVKVFNRTGQLVFAAGSPQFRWTPEIKMANETFIYFIDYESFSGNKWTQQGSITVFKKN